MSDYKTINGIVSRMSEKHCGYTQMSTRSIQMALNSYEKKVRKLEKENAELREFLSEVRGELHRMMVDIPVKYQSKKFLGICQDIGYLESKELEGGE